MVQFRELGGSSGSAPPIPLFYSGGEGFCLKEIGLVVAEPELLILRPGLVSLPCLAGRNQRVTFL